MGKIYDNEKPTLKILAEKYATTISCILRIVKNQSYIDKNYKSTYLSKKDRKNNN